MEATILGSSLLVPSVQEIAKDRKLVTVPHRYDRSDQDPPVLLGEHNKLVGVLDSSSDDLELEVPVVDMEGLIKGDVEELNKLHSACRDWGFFQLINHGVRSPLVEKFKSETQDFFNLPIEEKKRFWQRSDEMEGFGQVFVVSEEQKLDWDDIFYVTTFPIHERKPHLIPMLPSPYRETLEEYSEATRKLAIEVLECMARALGIDSMRFVFGEGNQMLRMNYYPACPEPEKVIGLTPHSDGVGLTILLQLNDMDGLQIMKNDKWVPIKPKPNAFVVNIGDILEILSNGIYKSIMHRAVVNSTKERVSVAAFFSPSLTKEIGPIGELITPETPQKFRRITMVDYWKGLIARVLDAKSYLDTMKVDKSE